MKLPAFYNCIFLFLLSIFLTPIRVYSSVDSIRFHKVLQDAEVEIEIINRFHESKMKKLKQRVEKIEFQLDKLKRKKGRRFLLKFQEKTILEDSIKGMISDLELNILKVRYHKGIELIKIVYEKTLSLDHHFSGMQTFSNIMALSNPNTYPNFQKAKSIIEEKTNKKFGIELPSLFETNPFISATSMLISSFLGNNKKDEKEKVLEDVACILDFTVRMNADLNLINYETEYLKSSNKEIMERCQSLFSEYTEIIGYQNSLKDCRKQDDWERLPELLGLYIDELKTDERELIETYRFAKKKVNIEFSTQRVSVFLNKYADFITLGEQYYQKFDNIISTYENEQICAGQLPRQFTELRHDIKTTIDKFSNTYDLPELQGSKLKKLLYGIIE